jgi:hypothetical protein
MHTVTQDRLKMCAPASSCKAQLSVKAQLLGASKPARTVYRRSKLTRAPRKRTFVANMSKCDPVAVSVAGTQGAAASYSLPQAVNGLQLFLLIQL